MKRIIIFAACFVFAASSGLSACDFADVSANLADTGNSGSAYVAAGQSVITAPVDDTPPEALPYTTFRNIPGITEAEVVAIDEVLYKYNSFTYGMLESTECFVREDGTIGGFAPLVCEWMSELFGIPVEAKVYTWDELRAGIRSGDIDFSGDFSPLENDREGLSVTGVFSERSITSLSLKLSPAPDVIAQSRPLKVAFLAESATIPLTLPKLQEQYGKSLEVIYLESDAEIEKGLKSGDFDLFFANNALVTELAFSDENLVASEFKPLTYKRVALTTGNSDLEPIIDAVDKCLENGALRYINSLYREGMLESTQDAFEKSLSKEEKNYLDEHLSGGTPVPVLVSTANYPVCYFDENISDWDGISVEVLEEISRLTGLTFVIANDSEATWSEIFDMLKSGEAPMIAELVRNSEREGHFLWTENPYTLDQYALISRTDFETVTTNQVLYSRVGLLRDTAYTEMFRVWFPEHTNNVYFDSQNEAFEALETGEIDLFMTTQLHFSSATNYLHRTDLKINLLFDYESVSAFGFGLGEGTLAGIIGKAQDRVDTSKIADSWKNNIYDYQGNFQQQQSKFFFWLAMMALFVILLLTVLLARRRSEGARLQALVDERTQELAVQVEATEAASEAKTNFLANMSHEMRTPLNAIIGLSELALGSDDTGGFAEKCPKHAGVFEHLEKIYTAGVTLLATVNDILDISKVEAGRLELVPDEYDLASLINDTVNLNMLRIGEKQIKFELELEENLPVRLVGDELRVKQICNNLLSNAFKYTKEGFVRWHIGYEENVAGADSGVLNLSVSDSGMGIHKEDIEKLFSEYNQVDTKANRHIEGTGLGLAITKRLAAMMGGSIGVESEYGKGSTFTVRIRQQKSGTEVIGAEAAEHLMSFDYSEEKRGRNANLVRFRMPYARVLIVDDVQTNLDVAKGMMKPYGMEIDCLLGGQEAVDVIRRGEPEYTAIFMDHMMPGMDGIEAVRIIREEIGTDYAKNIPIIALTANVIAGNDQMFLNSGFQEFLSKPIDVSKLDAVLRKWVRDPERDKEFETEDTAQGTHCCEADLPEIEGLDINSCLNRFGGDVDAALEVLSSFAVNTKPLLLQIRDIDEKDLAGYAVNVHGIKGASRGISATGLGAKAEGLEYAAKAGEVSFILEHNDEFIKDAETLIENIERYLADYRAAETPKPMMPEPDRKTLERLRDASVAYGMDQVDEAMSELESYSYERGGDIVSWLREQVSMLEFESIAQRLAEVLG